MPEKQSVFLICPQAKGYSALSLYVESDNSRLLALGLEALKNKNSKETSYEDVLKAQSDPKTVREAVGKLSAGEFGSGMIHIKEHDALKVSIAPAGNDFRLNISMRVGLDRHFNFGGKDQEKRDVVLRYDSERNVWETRALRLQDATGRSLIEGESIPISGIYFPVSMTGVYKIFARTGSNDPVTLLDR